MASGDKRVQVRIEVGHQSVCRTQKTDNGFTHDWSIFVRGAEGADISHFVEKVVFILHESFPKPKRVLKDPPYKVSESGYGSFNLPVEIYFRNKEEPRKYRLDYDLFLQLVGMPPVSNTKVEALTFLNPSEEFEQKLLKGGAVVLNVDASQPVKREPSTSPAASSSPVSVKKVAPVPVAPVAKSKIKENDVSPAVAVQAKRPAADLSPIANVKRKKPEKANDSAESTAKYLKEVSVLSPSLETVKIKTPSKDKKEKVAEFRDRKKPVDGFSSAQIDSGSPAPPTTKSVAAKETIIKAEEKGKPSKPEKKHGSDKRILSPVEREKSSTSPENPSERSELPRWQKITVKRTSTDAWSSIHQQSANSSEINSPVTKPSLDNTNNNTATERKGSERVVRVTGNLKPSTGGDGSSSDGELSEIDTQSSEKRETLVPSRVRNPSISSHGSVEALGTAALPVRDVKANSTFVISDRAPKQKLPATRNSGKTMPDGKTPPHPDELVDLYHKLTRIQDADTLQRIVDIVETSGIFEVNSSTFDFDLCSMDEETVQQIRDCL